MAIDEIRLAFESEAARYEAWYHTAAGRRADRAERALLTSLLLHFAAAETILDIGCGTGHFAPLFEDRGLAVFGVDRSPSMLGALRKLDRRISTVLGDARALPIRSRSVSVGVMVTALEFVPDPGRALSEALRVATQGLIVVALHRYSCGGLRRRLRRSPILGQANDFSSRTLRRLIETAAGDRLNDLRIRNALPPAGRLSLPIGDVIGAVATLRPQPGVGRDEDYTAR